MAYAYARWDALSAYLHDGNLQITTLSKMPSDLALGTVKTTVKVITYRQFRAQMLSDILEFQLPFDKYVILLLSYFNKDRYFRTFNGIARC